MIRLLRSQKGMTALEMLVAVAISVMVGAAIWSAVIFIDMQRVKSEIYGEMIGEVSQIFEKITFGYIPENDPNGER
ncbi:MAG: prepilin-type N-terminal cleavage/methylation domain-containing protein, partial [Candidatus Omnitrophica bacterium]|nr:prepilin-type N-terminal cleavage/methylation domain-containing protein [Candidatus Omnitrophota bacterium]